MNPVINIVAFQALWFAIVGGAAHGWPWLGPVALLAWLPAHLKLSPDAGTDLKLLVTLVIVGPLVDAVAMHLGLVRLHGPAPLPGLAPYWIMALWANLALTLNHSLRWMRGAPVWAGLLGAIGGPLAYYSGARLGAADLGTPLWQSLTGLAAIWGAAVLALGLAMRCLPQAVRA